MITNIIKYTQPINDEGVYALEVEYMEPDNDEVFSELLEFNTQAEQMKKYEELCK